MEQGTPVLSANDAATFFASASGVGIHHKNKPAPAAKTARRIQRTVVILRLFLLGSIWLTNTVMPHPRRFYRKWRMHSRIDGNRKECPALYRVHPARAFLRICGAYFSANWGRSISGEFKTLDLKAQTGSYGRRTRLLYIRLHPIHRGHATTRKTKKTCLAHQSSHKENRETCRSPGLTGYESICFSSSRWRHNRHTCMPALLILLCLRQSADRS